MLQKAYILKDSTKSGSLFANVTSHTAFIQLNKTAIIHTLPLPFAKKEQTNAKSSSTSKVRDTCHTTALDKSYH